tara:strand:+ start:340 stop:693 length:354 start_codon:yes stop_codon:yes gene_type:complete
MKTKKFIRRDTKRYAKLGKNKKSKQKWRKPKGRDNKMRLKRFSYPDNPTVGHKSSKQVKGKIEGKTPILVKNFKDLASAGKESIIILSGRLGAKKKIEIIKKAEESKLKIINLGGKK